MYTRTAQKFIKGASNYQGHVHDDTEAVSRLTREFGINAGLAWASAADTIVVYGDLGMSGGMKYGIKHAEEVGQTVEYRKIRGGAV